ncbi:MAG: type VI secretion system tip protein VgrG [Candidatus Rokubacteria bacterium]|nr:type VI secretion system tip protein VgrG [Candidatus Rokubacteria bacterium]
MVTQKTRPIGVKTPLGEDVLLLRSMTGSEHLGRLSQYELSVLSAEESVKMDDILGQNITIQLEVADDQQRFFNGYVSRFAQTGRTAGYATYQVTVRPWLWFLTRRQDCRIFQDMTVPEIIKKVFQDYDFADFDESLSGSYRKRGYCVQYRETDFDFVSRLMEEEGIYYYFKHQDGRHTLLLADSYGAHSLLPGYEKVPYYPPTENVVRKEEHVHDWAITREVMPGLCTLQDFDFQKPGVDLATRSKIQKRHALADFEIYDYPGMYFKEEDGKNYARARIEELHSQHEQVHGVANARGFMPGGLFELTGFPREDQNREYLIVSASYDLQTAEFETGGPSADGPRYACRFSAIESKTPYRTPRFTPKPVLQGPQTAIVVGKEGEEIWTDKFGRVKVQFHWDRLGKKDENSSCWVRVASVWAGKQWGGIHIPRIGQEVVVEFLEGDPDRPIVTGRVYNADAMPPYGLPDNATQSGLKSRSSKGGTGDNFNEIRFEDKKGNEELYIHAEKNHTNITENDRGEDVGHDRSLHVAHDKSEAIDNNKAIKVGVDHTEEIGANKTLKVGANHDESIGANMTINIASMLTENVGINYAETVGAAMELTIGAAFTETVGAVKAQTIGANKTVDVGANHSVSVGSSETIKVGGDKSDTVSGGKTISVGKDLKEAISGGHTETVTKAYALKAKSISVVAEDEITIKTGDASIGMKKNGDIVIKGKAITVKGSGDIVIKGSKVEAN